MADYVIGALQKGLRVLAVLCRQHERAKGQPVRLRDLAFHTGMPAAQLIRYLETLEGAGFVMRTDDRWAPGTKLVAMGYQVISTWLAYQNETGGEVAHGSAKPAGEEG